MTNFHPDTQWLTEYAAGTLAASQALCVSTHLSYCTQCAAKVAAMTQCGAALFSCQPARQKTDSSTELLDQIFADIEASPLDKKDQPEPPTARIETPAAESLPPVIQKLAPAGTRALRWKKYGSSLSVAKLNNFGEARDITLHKLQPGGTVPHHDHRGQEITVVLQGSFSDDDGCYNPGDFLVRDAGQTHQPRVENQQECLCLEVCDAPVKLTGRFARLLNPLLSMQHRH